MEQSKVTGARVSDDELTSPSRKSVDEGYNFAQNRDLLVAIVDRDATVCETLSLLFRLEGFKTTFYLSLDAFEAEAPSKRPDVAVIDLPACNGQVPAFIRRLRSSVRGVHLFFLSDDGLLAPAVEAMREGAAAVVAKPVDKEALLRMVAHELRRGMQLGPREGAHRHVEILGFSSLTDRERDVLECLADGMSNKESAIKLNISPRTVEVHRSSVMHKLGARNTAELMRIVFTS